MWKPLRLARVKSRSLLQMFAKELYLKRRGDSVFWLTNIVVFTRENNEYDRKNKDSSLYPNIWNTSAFINKRSNMIVSKSRLHTWVHSTSPCKMPPSL
ncbi:hypothetical protein HPG69_019800 [Diceros bicornis minor]|uniref:Uncharacterized protein n=1 Tax=Diceros bicornis minor TaxID=77932 RepID=A0A7J7EQZ0_DICBM|nr:hypothetical protein HPG69_019800 [Diceros bicornis minor]